MSRCYSASESRLVIDRPISETDICSICLDTYKATCNLFPTRTPCGHIFHYTCLSKWSRLHNNCPMCRGEINCCMVEPTPVIRPIINPIVTTTYYDNNYRNNYIINHNRNNQINNIIINTNINNQINNNR